MAGSEFHRVAARLISSKPTQHVAPSCRGISAGRAAAPFAALWQQICQGQAGRREPLSFLQLAAPPPVAAKFISSAPAYSPIQGAEKVSGNPRVMPGGTSKMRGPLKASPRQSAVTERGAAPGFTMGICRHQAGSPGVGWCNTAQACIKHAACGSSRPATTAGAALTALRSECSATGGLQQPSKPGCTLMLYCVSTLAGVPSLTILSQQSCQRSA